MFSILTRKLKGRYRRAAAEHFARRPCRLGNDKPIISFTFDDFPSSALHEAGGFLERAGVRGTYYASIGLMDQMSPTGKIFNQADLSSLLERGHELGCHTYAHCHAYETSARKFEASIMENKRALNRLAPGATMVTLSYPIGCPRPSSKQRCAKHFLACRAGGQTYNVDVADLNNLRAFFLEQSRDDIEAIKTIIARNAQAGGWLVFATHDVCEAPTRYGCKPAFFETVVKLSVESGASVLTMSEALKKAGITEQVLSI